MRFRESKWWSRDLNFVLLDFSFGSIYIFRGREFIFCFWVIVDLFRLVLIILFFLLEGNLGVGRELRFL